MEVLKLEENDEQKKEQERVIIINGGVEMQVIHNDGTKELVKVRHIPATKLEQFMTKIADESTSVSIFCDKPLEWVDSLSQESFTEVVEKGIEINRKFLGKWCSRRAMWTEMLNVGIIADLQRKIAALNEVLGSFSSAQKLHTSTDSPQSK